MRDALWVLLPVVVVLAVLPAFYSNHLLLFNFVVFMMLAQGINVIYGFTGYLPFGYVGFFGAGAYGFSLLVMHLAAPPLLALLGGVVAAALVGLLLTPLFRLSGAYFAIANLAAALAVLQVVANPALQDDHQRPLRREPERRLQSGPRLWCCADRPRAHLAARHLPQALALRHGA